MEETQEAHPGLGAAQGPVGVTQAWNAHPRTWDLDPSPAQVLAGAQTPQGRPLLEPQAARRPAHPGSGQSGPFQNCSRGFLVFGIEMPPFSGLTSPEPLCLAHACPWSPAQTPHFVPSPRSAGPAPSLGPPALALQPAAGSPAPQLPSDRQRLTAGRCPPASPRTWTRTSLRSLADQRAAHSECTYEGPAGPPRLPAPTDHQTQHSQLWVLTPFCW